jgi:hypothetical protein
MTEPGLTEGAKMKWPAANAVPNPNQILLVPLVLKAARSPPPMETIPHVATTPRAGSHHLLQCAWRAVAGRARSSSRSMSSLGLLDDDAPPPLREERGAGGEGKNGRRWSHEASANVRFVVAPSRGTRRTSWEVATRDSGAWPVSVESGPLTAFVRPVRRVETDWAMRLSMKVGPEAAAAAAMMLVDRRGIGGGGWGGEPASATGAQTDVETRWISLANTHNPAAASSLDKKKTRRNQKTPLRYLLEMTAQAGLPAAR